MNTIANLNYPYAYRNIVAVRHEDIGKINLILWSKGLDKYFYIDDQTVLSQVKEVIQRKKDGSNHIYQGINSTLRADLEKIGFNGEMIEFNRSLRGRLSAPLESYFDYNTECNLHCFYCYNKKGEHDISRGDKAQVKMNSENIQRVLSTLRENGVMRNHLAGGEPTLNLDRLKTYLEISRDLKLNQSIVTNGLLLGKNRHGEEACEIIMNNDLVTATVSIDGYNKETYEAVRGKENWSKFIEGTKQLIFYRDRAKSRTVVQWRKVWFPDTPVTHVEGIVQMGIQLGVDAVQFHCPERSLYNENGYYGKTSRGYYDLALNILRLQKKYEGNISIWNVWNPVVGCGEIGLPGMYGCVGAQELIAIHPTGGLAPCLMDQEYLGNLLTDWDGDLGRFWRESRLLSVFQGFATEPDPHCLGCQVIDHCRGGSVVRRKVEYGSNHDLRDGSKPAWVGKRDPLCAQDYTEANKRNLKKIKFPTGLETESFKTIVVAHSL